MAETHPGGGGGGGGALEGVGGVISNLKDLNTEC